MGRELRMVPKDWEHPKDTNNVYIPLFEGSYKAKVSQWDKEAEMWGKGKQRKFDEDGDEDGWVDIEDKYKTMPYKDWNSKRPEEKDYMPDWNPEERTHLMMYESATEGTPISPVCETPEQLAHWLCNHAASAFAGNTATYEQWMSTIKSGWAPSAMRLPSGELISGVAAT